uniref:Pco103361 n=1 Tax=Arundo donax TaxID=35708 RepID=A0A0A9ASC7_ARUDO
MLHILLESSARKTPVSIAPLHKTEALHPSFLQHDPAQAPDRRPRRRHGPPSSASSHTARGSPRLVGSPPPTYPSDRAAGRSTSPCARRSGNPPSLRSSSSPFTVSGADRALCAGGYNGKPTTCSGWLWTG